MLFEKNCTWSPASGLFWPYAWRRPVAAPLESVHSWPVSSVAAASVRANLHGKCLVRTLSNLFNIFGREWKRTPSVRAMSVKVAAADSNGHA